MLDDLNGDALVAYRVEQARNAHARGLVLTPVSGKRPIGKAWQKQPAPSLKTVENWARAGNVGLRTGTVSGVICIDDDTEDQGAAATLGLPTGTPTLITGRGHANRLYRAPADFVVKNSAGLLAEHVDMRGENGMVVFTGSIHPDTGKPYRWADGLSPDDVPFAELPPEILDRLRPDAKNGPPAGAADAGVAPKAKAPGQRHARYSKAALKHAVERMSSATEGTRNDTLNTEAYGLGRLVGAGWLHEEDVRPALTAAARSAGLSDVEVAATLESGLAKGIADPVDESILSEPVPLRPRRHDDRRPNILIVGGALPEVVSAAERALLANSREPFFERSGLPVRIVRAATAARKHGIHRPAGALSLVLLEAPYLVEAFMHSAVFERINDNGTVVLVNCPDWVARHYLARRGLWHIAHLEQVIEVPIMRRDGTLLLRDGFDPETELYLDSSGLLLPPIPDEPTLDDARRAMAVLKIPLKDFPFVEESDRAAALAALLTPLVRPWLRSAPLFAFRAPKMASGKSLLADLVALLATGRVAPVMSPGRDDEEIRKRITAFLLAGFPMGCIDNIEQPFGSDVMCSILTQAVYCDRILGKSDMVTLPTAVTWTATGNNLQFVGDVTTRVVPCDLDPRVEEPEARRFDVDLYRYMPAHRAELVAAGLTILRAFQVAGQPDQGLSVFGRFEEWSAAVRSPLVWLGEADACAGMPRIRSVDPVREQLRLILAYWHMQLGEKPVPAAAVIQLAEQLDNCHPFRRAIEELTRADNAPMDSRRLGHWLAKVERRVEGGLQVVRMGDRQGTALWSVRWVDPPSVGCVGIVGSPGSVPNAGETAAPPVFADSEAPLGAEPPVHPGPAATGNNPQIPHIPPGDGVRPQLRRRTLPAADAGDGCGTCPG